MTRAHEIGFVAFALGPARSEAARRVEERAVDERSRSIAARFEVRLQEARRYGPG